jgi:hypothetical protein
MNPGVINVFIFVVNVLMSCYRNREKQKAAKQKSQDLDVGNVKGGPEEKNNK